MKRHAHGKDPSEFPAHLRRRVGKNGSPAWQMLAVARAAPELLADAPEDDIRQLVRLRIREVVLENSAISISFDDVWLTWLVMMARAGHWQAKAILKEIKSLPDELVLKKVKSEPYARALSLELKRGDGGDGGKPGQKRLREVLDSYIVAGYEASMKVLEEFLK